MNLIPQNQSQKQRRWLFTYHHNGGAYSLTVTADSPQDAAENVKAMANAEFDGELICTVPQHFGWLAKAATWLANRWDQRTRWRLL